MEKFLYSGKHTGICLLLSISKPYSSKQTCLKISKCWSSFLNCRNYDELLVIIVMHWCYQKSRLLSSSRKCDWLLHWLHSLILKSSVFFIPNHLNLSDVFLFIWRLVVWKFLSHGLYFCTGILFKTSAFSMQTYWILDINKWINK